MTTVLTSVPYSPLEIQQFLLEAHLAEEKIIKKNQLTDRIIGFIKQEIDPVLHIEYEVYVTKSFLVRPILHPIRVGNIHINYHCGHPISRGLLDTNHCVVCRKYQTSSHEEQRRIYPIIKLMTERGGRLESLRSPGKNVCYSSTNWLKKEDIERIYFNWISCKIKIFSYERWVKSQDLNHIIGDDIITDYFPDINPERIKSRIYQFIR